MARRVQPKGFRLKELNDWHSRGFYGRNPDDSSAGQILDLCSGFCERPAREAEQGPRSDQIANPP